MGAEWEGVTLHAIPGIASLMDEWIEKGHGKEDWTIIGSRK
jgi:3-hydroxyisobutyrate dehydrogenase